MTNAVLWLSGIPDTAFHPNMLPVTFDQRKRPKDGFVAESHFCKSKGAPFASVGSMGGIIRREIKVFMIPEEEQECYKKEASFS